MNLDIYQLSKLVSKQKVMALGLFKDSKVNSETKYLYLYENILNDSITNDDEAKIALNYSQASKAFAKFKERYTKKIIDYITLSDVSILSAEYFFEEQYKLLKLSAVAKLIRLNQQKQNSIKIYTYIYNQAKKLEIFDLQLSSGLELRKHYAFIEPDKKKFLFYEKELEKVQKSINRNIELVKIYDRLSHENLSTKEQDLDKYKLNTLKTSEALLDNLLEDETLINASKIYEIAAFGYTINNEINKSIQVSKKLVSLYQQFEYAPKVRLYAAYNAIMSSYLKLGDHENAKLYLTRALSMYTKKNFNYFRLKSLEYAIYANTKDYSSLFKITYEVMSSKSLSNFKSLQQEWKLREAYANILVESGLINPDKYENINYKPFKLSKFLNEVNKFTSDKRGTNISILVVELIHFLIRKQYDKLTDRLDSLNQYTFRYLRKDHTFRSNCFIKMLLKLPDAEYHPLRTIRYVTKYEKKLKENPFEVSLKQVDSEIIPFEYLWEIILDILDLNLVKKKK